MLRRRRRGGRPSFSCRNSSLMPLGAASGQRRPRFGVSQPDEMRHSRYILVTCRRGPREGDARRPSPAPPGSAASGAGRPSGSRAAQARAAAAARAGRTSSAWKPPRRPPTLTTTTPLGGKPPPLLHVEYELQRDDPPPADDAAADAALARDLLERLAALVPAGRGGLAALQPNAPPLLCAERLSFYLCAVLLLAADARMRGTWLRERSTRARLAFVGELVMRAEQQRPSTE